VLVTEGLVLESMPMGHMRAGCQAELPIVSVCMVWTEAGKSVCIIGPRSYYIRLPREKGSGAIRGRISSG
jgi:hypothetical protein